jgi:NAD(P)-dependent dehydrogenase (short-subunit alcohol dehydrogenase family)
MYNPFSLEGKTILVTGASSGIGKATAIECSKMGANLIITGRNSKKLNDTFERLDGSAHQKIEADLTLEEERNNLIEELSILNGIVHCAGISGHYLFPFLKKDSINQMFDINYYSSLYLTLSILKKKKLTNSSSIVFITSTSGIISSYIGGSLYSSTKGALNGLIKGMALDLAPKKIRVNSVMPSMVNTSIMEEGSITKEQFDKDKELYPLKRYGEPEEIAYGAIYLLSDASLWITGTNLLMDGGRSASY